MPRACIDLEVDCSVCLGLSFSACPAVINLPLDLTPDNQLYLWFRDRFQNLYYDLVTVNLDGSIDVNPDNFPEGFFFPKKGFDVFLTTDITGLDIVLFTVDTIEYSCINLSLQ